MRSGPKFDERETAGREHIERVPQEFIGARAEVVEPHRVAKDLGELRDAREVRESASSSGFRPTDESRSAGEMMMSRS